MQDFGWWFSFNDIGGDSVSLDRKQITLIGFVACIGTIVSLGADVLTGWSTSPNQMSSAISIDLESVRGLYDSKPRWSFVLGNYLGVFFIPFQMCGFLLVYLALRPAGKTRSLIFLITSFYFVAVGAGYHGTFAFIGDTIQSGDDALLEKMTTYWYGWGLVLVAGYLSVCVYAVVLILSGNTLYPRWCVLLSPLSLMLLSAILIEILPEAFTGLKAFIAVTGLNFPLLVFFLITLFLLRTRSGRVELGP